MFRMNCYQLKTYPYSIPLKVSECNNIYIANFWGEIGSENISYQDFQISKRFQAVATEIEDPTTAHSLFPQEFR